MADIRDTLCDGSHILVGQLHDRAPLTGIGHLDWACDQSVGTHCGELFLDHLLGATTGRSKNNDARDTYDDTNGGERAAQRVESQRRDRLGEQSGRRHGLEPPAGNRKAFWRTSSMSSPSRKRNRRPA